MYFFNISHRTKHSNLSDLFLSLDSETWHWTQHPPCPCCPLFLWHSCWFTSASYSTPFSVLYQYFLHWTLRRNKGPMVLPRKGGIKEALVAALKVFDVFGNLFVGVIFFLHPHFSEVEKPAWPFHMTWRQTNAGADRNTGCTRWQGLGWGTCLSKCDIGSIGWELKL